MGSFCRALYCYSKSCVEHNDCVGEFDMGRLPYCNKKEGICDDITSSSCATPSICIMEAINIENQNKIVGSIQLSLNTDNATLREMAAHSLIVQLNDTTNAIQSTLSVSVQSSESVVMDSTLFTENDSEVILDYIKSLRCGVMSDYCIISLNEGVDSRRLKGLSDESRNLAITYTVTVAFEVDDEVFLTIMNSPTFDDPEFAALLAFAAGVNETQVDIHATDGSIRVVFTLLDESTEEDPVDEGVFDDIRAIQSSLVGIKSNVVSELGLDEDDVSLSSVDLCSTRNCNGFGSELCNPDTGVCLCPPGWWGVNCDVQTSCINGGTPLGSLCLCTYPYYGLRCELTSVCSGNEECV